MDESDCGAGEEIRTLDPHLGKVEPAKANRINAKGMRGKKKPLTLPLTLECQNPSTDNPPKVASDLAKLTQAWPCLPPEIKTAIRAIVAPYIKEGDDE